MENPPVRLAHRAAKLLRAFAANFDGKNAPASVVERLGKLDLPAVAGLLENMESVFDRTAPDRLQARIAELEAQLKQKARTETREARKTAKLDTSSSGEGGGFRRPYYQFRFPSRVCMNCRKHFLSARPDAKTCSPKCRVALYRRKRRDPKFAAKIAAKVA